MERPVKRQRIALDPLGTDDEDELDCEPNELNQRRDPVYQLERARARASNKLKSRFENIFAKYEKDFTGVGDEINLRTGEVVVNNGHLQSITGVQEFGEGDGDEDEDAHFSGSDRPVQGVIDEALKNDSSDAVVRRNPWEVVGLNSDSSRPASGVGRVPGLSSTMPPAHEPFMPPLQPFGFLENGHTQVVDPAWQAPELPRSAFMSPRFGAQAQQHIFGMGRTTKVTRRSLLEPGSHDGEEEDVLLGAPDNVLGKKESPLIKSKFPTVGSSPNNDPGLHEMIQDVIQNIANTSPTSEQSRKGASGTRPPAKSRMNPVRPDAAINCKQGKKQTSDNGSSSTGKAKAVSSNRTDGESPCENKRRGRQITVVSPVKVATIRQKKQPKSHNGQQTTGSTGEPDHSGVTEDEFLDVTGNTPVKPAGQTFYVEIKARKVGQSDSFARDPDDNELSTVGRGSLGVGVSDRTLQSPLYGPLDVEEKGADAGTLLSGKEKRMAAVAGIDGQALHESRPTIPQKQAKERFERNIVDPSYEFSDEENLLPRRKRNSRRNPEPASRASVAAQDASRVGQKAKAGRFPQTTVAPDASDQEKWNGAARPSSRPSVEGDAAIDATEVSRSSQEQRSEQMVCDDPPAVPLPASHLRTRRNRPEKLAEKQPKQQATEKPQPRSLRGRSRNKSGDGLHGPPEPRHKSPPVVVASIPAVAEEGSPPSAKPPKTAEPAPVPPSTPQPKSKSRSEKTGASRSGLISLLSDDDDEEDEISFNLADFTPSGHHRILAMRPHHHQPATSSTGKNRRVASLLFGPASTSKVGKHSTPGSTNKNGKRRRRSTNTLLGSVVKVRRDSPRAPSPAVSVVQTPGGTKRRCGEDGFRCERDFCFVCISI